MGYIAMSLLIGRGFWGLVPLDRLSFYCPCWHCIALEHEE